MTITVTARGGPHDPCKARDLRNARLQLQDLLLGFVGRDGARGRLVYDVAKSCRGEHRTDKSASGAVSAPDPWRGGPHRWITVLELPCEHRNGATFSLPDPLTPDVQARLRTDTSCSITVVREDWPLVLCAPYVFIAGSNFLAVDHSVSMIQKEIDKYLHSKPSEQFWYDSIDNRIKTSIREKAIAMNNGTINVSVDGARIKLGSHGYCFMAHEGGAVAEGRFACDHEGNITFTWKRSLVFARTSSEWMLSRDKSFLPASFCLADGRFFVNSVNGIAQNKSLCGVSILITLLDSLTAHVLLVVANETVQTLWGGLPDPMEALKENDFLMKHIRLTAGGKHR